MKQNLYPEGHSNRKSEAFQYIGLWRWTVKIPDFYMFVFGFFSFHILCVLGSFLPVTKTRIIYKTAPYLTVPPSNKPPSSKNTMVVTAIPLKKKKNLIKLFLWLMIFLI